MRRLIVEEPVTRAAEAASRLALFAMAVTLISVAIVRFGLVDAGFGLVALGAGLMLAISAIVFAVAAFVRIWRLGRRGLARSIKASLLAGAILAWPAWLAARSVTLPMINDVSTNPDNPPSFSRSRAALEARGGRSPAEPSEATRALQRSGYPDLASLVLDVSAGDAFDIVQKAAQRRGWQIIEAIRPGGRIGSGRLDAVDRTFLLHLSDDVTLRITPLADGSRIDMRSASRIGRHDFGANAARIRRFLDEVNTAAQDAQ
jgi:Protein of unknown function (DUF1499)